MIARIYAFIMYGALFTVTIFFSFLTAAADKKNIKYKTIIYAAIVILLPCLFAGMRADNVGTDIHVYAKPIFLQACSSERISTLVERFDVEFGYASLAFFVSRISSSLGVFLFFTELMIMLPVFIVAYRRREISPIWLTITVYLLVFYCATFNIMRQSISAAWLLLAFQFFEEKKFKSAVIFAIISILFHSSTPIGIAMFIFAYFICHIKVKQKRLYILILLSLISIVGIVILVNRSFVMSLLLDKGFLSDKYSLYYRVFSPNGDTNYYLFNIILANYFELAFRIIFAIASFSIFNTSKRRSMNTNLSMYAIIILMSTLIYSAVFIFLHSSYGLRIVWQGEWIALMLWPPVISETGNNTTFKLINRKGIFILFILVLYFSIGYIGFGWHGINPLAFR